MEKAALGKLGEDFACRYLLENGMKVLEHNFRAGKGEIDVIARDRQCIVFIEVKTRSNALYGSPGEAVTLRKQKMIIQTAVRYMSQNGLLDCEARFDVAEVYRDGKTLRINYIKDAFGIE